jgi:vancomycin resistance protein YoaR
MPAITMQLRRCLTRLGLTLASPRQPIRPPRRSKHPELMRREKRAAQTRVLLALGLGVAAMVILVISTVLGFQFATWNRITPGVAVLDVTIGGLTLPEAEARLAPRVSAILDQRLELSLRERTWITSARDLGVRLEPAELARRAYGVGRDGPPLARLNAHLDALRGGAEIPVFEEADGAQIDALVARIAAEVFEPVRDARLVLREDGILEFATSQAGLELDQGASRAEVAQALTDGAPRARLVARTIAPAVLTEQVADAHDQLQRILAPEPIELTAAEHTRSLERHDVLGFVSLDQPGARGARATVSIERAAVDAVVAEMARQVDRSPVDARFTWSGGRLSLVRAGRDGRRLDAQAAADLVSSQILLGARSIELPVAVVRPAVPSDDGGASLGIRELIEESTTTFAGSVPEKAHNIRLAAQRLDGVVVPPGGTFSFNAEVGPTTLESGFQWGFGLTTGSGGGAHTVPSVAGGICQVATTLFQSVFWAGYQLEERYWHLYWIPAYTSRGVVGLDATVDADAGLDFKWINPTSDFVLIQASTAADSVTFRLYGRRPAWTVQVDPPAVSGRVAPDPTPDVQPEPLLAWGRVVPVETARDGFQVQLARHVISDAGGAPRDLVLKSVYQPGRNVTLVGTASAPDAASVAAAVDRVRGSMQPAAAPPAPATIATPNGPRTLAQIREELRLAGWGGGSDEDAVATYNRLAAAATGN